MAHEVLLAIVVGLQCVVVLFQCVIVIMQWFKYRHQRQLEEKIGPMERILEIADKVMFNQSKFFPMMTAMSEVYRHIVGDDLRRQMAELGNGGLPE